MTRPIEDYALLSDLHSAALVARDGSIDWLTFPRFDSAACFAALLGTDDHGHWTIAPAGEIKRTTRRYWPGTLVLETVFETDDGSVAVIDCMPPRDTQLDVVRLVRGLTGTVAMRMDLTIRFDYGSVVPWVRRVAEGIVAVAGPDRLKLTTPVELRGENFHTIGEFSVSADSEVPFVLTWQPSHEPDAVAVDARSAITTTAEWWEQWSGSCSDEGRWQDDVRQSVVVLKGLTYGPTGGLIAAPTTSLPEQIGGPRNWDYRYCWLRDATFSLTALLDAGFTDEASAWRDWLLRAVAGEPARLQIMYGPAGERRLTELELPWLPGYERSQPVRVGNEASTQFQLDVYGEVMDVLHVGRTVGLDHSEASWDFQVALLDYLEGAWQEPDEGIWEVRGPRQHFTHSKVMAWVAFDRAVKAVGAGGHQGSIDRWRQLRADIHRDVLTNGVDDRGVLVQHYGSTELDASLLMVPMVGFLPAHDPRVRNTVEAIERELVEDGFVRRYVTRPELDGLPAGEGAFLLCSFWLADALALIGRRDDAVALFERLLALRNDVGLLAEEYDPQAKRMLGNMPQAFSHTAIVNTATLLGGTGSGRRARIHDPSHGSGDHV